MTHRCFCGSTGESTRCSTFWLWSEVRAWPLPNLSLYPQTYTSAYWNGKNWLYWLYYPKLEYYFDSKVILIDHSTMFFFSILLSTSCHLTPSEFQEEKKKHYRGHRVTSGMSRLICLTRRCQQSVSVCSESQHASVYLQSGSDHLPLSSERNRGTHTRFMFVCHCRGFHGYHTDTGAQRSEATSASVGPRWIGLTPVRGRTDV